MMNCKYNNLIRYLYNNYIKSTSSFKNEVCCFRLLHKSVTQLLEKNYFVYQTFRCSHKGIAYKCVHILYSNYCLVCQRI